MDLISDLKNKQIPNFDKNPAKELENYLNMFLDLRICDRGDGYVDTYERLLVAFHEVSENINQIISDIVNQVPYMRKFLIIHSVFDINTKKGDWLQRFMAEILQPTPKDMEWFHSKPIVPKDIMDKLSILDPESIRWMNDPIMIKYKMWGKVSDGDSYEPINIIDLDWKSADKERQEKKSIWDYGVIAF